MSIPEHRLTSDGIPRVAESFRVGEFFARYRVPEDIIGTVVSGAGAVAHVADESGIALTVSGASGDLARAATHQHFHGRPDAELRGALYFLCPDAGQTNQRKRWGLFNNSDGAFLELDGTTLYAVIRTSVSGSPVDTRVDQATWNIDRMDGSGGLYNPSGALLDLTKIHHLTVRIGYDATDFFIDSKHVHRVLAANALSAPQYGTRSMQLRAEVENTGASSAGALRIYEGAVTICEASTFPHRDFGHSATRSIGAGDYPILSLRPAATFEGVVNEASIWPRVVHVDAGNGSVVKVIQGATLVTPTWTAEGPNSVAEYDVSAASLSGGEVVASLRLSGNDPRRLSLKDIYGPLARQLLVEVDGTQRTLTVAINGSGSGYVDLGWAEYR